MCKEKNVVNNEDRSCLRAPVQNGPYKKKPTQNSTKHADVTDIQTKLFLCALDFFYRFL